MVKEKYEFIIGSPSERENLICEIWYDDEILAEISKEEEEFEIEIYSSIKRKWWTLSLSEFQEALEHAKNGLIFDGSN